MSREMSPEQRERLARIEKPYDPTLNPDGSVPNPEYRDNQLIFPEKQRRPVILRDKKDNPVIIIQP